MLSVRNFFLFLLIGFICISSCQAQNIAKKNIPDPKEAVEPDFFSVWVPRIVTFQVIAMTFIYFMLGKYNSKILRKSRRSKQQQNTSQSNSKKEKNKNKEKENESETTTTTTTTTTSTTDQISSFFPILNELNENESQHLNPFVNTTIFLSNRERLKLSFATVTYFPLRVILCISSLIFCSLCSQIAMLGYPKYKKGEEIKPLKGWRKLLTRYSLVIGIRLFLFSFGYLNIKVKGKPTRNANKAPVIICNHNTFIEPLAIQFLTPVSPVGKAELRKLPLFGSCFIAVQTVFVDRLDPSSRQETVEQIRNRAKPGSGWPQVMIFPEGTRTNGKALITYKLGPFSPGVPIEIVTAKFPWKYCDPSSVKHGPSQVFLSWKLMCQVYNEIELDFHQVYTPTEEEKQDPKLFSENVRILMSKYLQVPTTEHSLDDVLLQLCAKKVGEPMEQGVIQLRNLRKFLDIDVDTAKEYLQRFASLDTEKTGRLTLKQFAQGFKTEVTPEITHLFETLDVDQDGSLDFRDYLIGLSVLNEKSSNKTKDALKLAFHVFDTENKGYLTKAQLALILRKVYPDMTEEKVNNYFTEADTNKSGQINCDQFVAFAEKYPQKLPLFKSAFF